MAGRAIRLVGAVEIRRGHGPCAQARSRPRGSLSVAAAGRTAVPARSRAVSGWGRRGRVAAGLVVAGVCDRLGRLRLGQMGQGGFQSQDRAQAGGGAAEGGVDGVVGAGAAGADGLAGALGGGAGLGVDHALGQRAGGVAATAHLVGDEGGHAPVAVGQRHLEHAPRHPLELAQALLGRQLFHLGERLDQLLEVGLGQEGVDLALGHGLDARQPGGRHAAGETVRGAQLAARGGQQESARGWTTSSHGGELYRNIIGFARPVGGLSLWLATIGRTGGRHLGRAGGHPSGAVGRGPARSLWRAGEVLGSVQRCREGPARREGRGAMKPEFAAAAVLAAVLGLTGPSASANQFPDLAGEYHGTELCDELDNGTPGVFAETSPIFIAQGKGGRFRMLFRLADGKADVLYEGILKRVAGSDQVEGVAIACGGAFASSEVIRLRPIGSSGGQPFFNGESQFFTNDFPGRRRCGELRHLQICLSARRRDQADGAEVRGVAVRGGVRRGAEPMTHVMISSRTESNAGYWYPVRLTRR